MNLWSLWSERVPFAASNVVSANVSGALQRLGLVTLFLLAIFGSAMTALPAQADYPTNQTVYFDTAPVNLTVSSQWSGVQVATNVSLESVAQAGGNGKIYPRQRIVLFPSVKSDAELMALNGAKRIARVFNNAGLPPIVESDDVLVRFQPGVSSITAQQVALSVGGTLGSPLGPQSPNAYHLFVNTNTSAITASNLLRQKAEVKWAYPNFIWPKKKRLMPNDPLFGQSDHLNNTGQNGGQVNADINAPEAWDLTTGNPQITVAIIDDGVDQDHEDFAGRIVSPRDVVDDENDARPGVGDNHGTACTGLALASINNSLGSAGVAPNCRIMPIRFLDFAATLVDEAEAFRWAADNGADVISCSYGPPDNVPPTDPSQLLATSTKDAIDYATTTGRGGKGCVILVAAGNGNENMDSDGFASYPKVIAVGSTNNSDRKASYSDFGTSLDIVAPGGDLTGVVTTDRMGAAGYTTGNYTPVSGPDRFIGTSAACPVAAGVAALILSRDSGMTYSQVRITMQTTADKVGGVVYDSNGHNDNFGSGRVNAFAALNSIVVGPTYSISGVITTPAGAPVPGIIVTATALGVIAVTGADGSYVLNGIPPGTSTQVVPSNPNFTFTPPFRNAFIGSTDLTGYDFVAQTLPKVTLIDPPSNTTINTPTYLMRATTANNSVVQRVDFERTGDLINQVKQVSKPIPDATVDGPSLITDDVLLANAGTAASVLVQVNITHPRVQDLVINLVAPDGKRFLVYPQTGPQFNSTLVLSVQVNASGSSLAGRWTLEVSDTVDAAFDPIGSGTLNSWGLLIRPWVLIASATRADPTTGEWQASWPINQTPPGVYDVRAVAIAPGTTQQDVHFAIVIPQPGIVLIRPATDEIINAPIDLLAQGTSVGVIQRVDFQRRGKSPTFTNGTPASPLNLFIPDLTTVTSELVIPGGGLAEDATLHLKLNHQFIGDVKITLVAPDGTQIVVLDDPTLNEPNFVRDIPLPSLIGKTFAGTYKLIIQDRSVPDTGTLVTWGLTFRLPWVTIGSDNTDTNGRYTLPFNPISIPGGIYDFRALAVTARGEIEDVNTNITVISPTKPTYTISGLVTKGGNPLPGVLVTRTGGGLASATATTDSAGKYTLPPAIDGTYTITPSLAGHSFTPLSRRVTLNGGDLANINFTAVAGYSISGTITSTTGAPLANVTVKRSGAAQSGTVPAPISVTTDANGIYSFAGLPSATYTITPVLTNAQFTPLSRTVTLNTTSIENVNFTGVTGFAVKGRITTVNGTPINNVRISRGGGTVTATTNLNGEYTLSAVPNGTFFVVPSRPGFTFTPASRSITVRNADLLNVDFIAVQGVTISGRVINTNSQPLGGVRIERTGNGDPAVAVTNAEGRFVFNSVPAGTYNIRPVAKNYAFTPAFQNVIVEFAPVTTTTFRGLPDSAFPTVKVTQPLPGRNYASLAQATGTATDTGSGLLRVTGRLFRAARGTTPAAYWAGGNSWTPTYTSANEIVAAGTTNWSINFPPLQIGTYSFRAAATDKAGNTAASPDITFTIGAAGAIVRVLAPVSKTYTSFIRPPSTYGTTTSNGAPVVKNTVRLFRAASQFAPAGYWAGGNNWTTTYSPAQNEVLATGLYSWSLALPTLVPTNYTLRVTATDNKGTPGYSPEVNFTISNGS
jgi:subtilisin family serine protease/subtilisin-like proprotein convertase family protein